MKREYDFSKMKGRKNPFAGRLKAQAKKKEQDKKEKGP